MVFTLMPISAFAEDGAVEIAAPACTCATACTAESMNTACAVCGADGATPEQCANYVAPEQPTDTPAPAATLTVLLPVGLKVEGMEKVDDSTSKVTRTVGENGISPIVITSEEEGAFSEKLAEALNNNDAFKNNSLTAAYDETAKTLTVTGKPTATADFSLNMGEILAVVTQTSANEIMLAEENPTEDGANEDTTTENTTTEDTTTEDTTTEDTTTENITPEDTATEDTTTENITPENTATEDGTTGDTNKDPVTLTLLLPEGLSADGMDTDTCTVTRTVDENGSIAPIVISCEDAGSFSTELAEQINKDSSISENGLSAAYDSENDTLIISGNPTTSAELDFEKILTAAMDAMGEYETLVAAQTISTDIILANGKELTIVEQITISGNVTISGNGTITRTDANGYISVPSGATLTLDGVTVDGNNLAGTYGMILVEGGTLIIKDSTVQNCVASATRGGAISVESNGNLTIDNTTIQNCQNRSEGGGAIYIESSTVTINSGTFKNNKAVYEYNGQSYWRDGGFIYNYKGTLTINGGTFENNSAGEGGAIYTANSSNTWTNIYGGTFTGNTANDSGKEGSGAVFVQGSDLSSYGFRLSGAATFVGGVQADGTDGIYFSYTNSPMQITSALQSDVYVYLNSIDSWGTKTIAKGTDSYTLTETDAEHLKCYNGTLTDTTTWYTLLNTSKNCLNFSKTPPQQRHCICGSSTCTSTTGGHTGYSTYWTAWNETTSLPTTAGNYYLMKDVTLSDTWTVSANINLCLNGNTITGASGVEVITVDAGASLAITDCQTNVGKITGGKSGIANNGTLALWNGSITGNSITGSGGGVNNSGTFTMNGGSITKNYASNYGGGVYNCGNFSMTGGSIANNSANFYGGGVYNYSSSSNNFTMTMTGGSIAENTAYFGGGVYNYGTLTMSNGSIINNATDSYYNQGGGGVYNAGTLNMSGTPIVTGNTLGGTDGTRNNVYVTGGLHTIDVNTGNPLTTGANVGISGKVGNTVVYYTTETTGFFCDDTNYELKEISTNKGLMLSEIQVTIKDVKLLNTAGGTEMTDNTKVYDGNAVAYSEGTYEPATVTGVTLTYTWQEKAADSDTYTAITGNAAPIDAGSYRLHVTATRGNAELGTANYDFTITKATGDGTVTLDGWTYGGTANTPTATSTTNPETTTDKITYLYKVEGTADDTYKETQPTDAGEYTVKATFPANDNYTAATATADFTIKPKTLTVNVKVKDRPYDGTTDAEFDGEPTLTGVVAGDSGKVTATVANPAFEDKNVGTGKKVTASISLTGDAAGNYTVNDVAETTASISVKEVSITGVTVEGSKTYDRSASATPIMTDAEIDGKVATDSLSITVGKATYNNANVGTGKTVSFTGFALTGTDAANYKLKGQPESTTADITAKEVTISGVTIDTTKVYDGNDTAKITNIGTLADVLTGDTVTIKTGKATYDGKNVGDNKTVTFTGFALEGTDAGNYTLKDQPAGTTAAITQREVTVSGLSATKTYDGDKTADRSEITGTPVVGNKAVDSDNVSLNTESMTGIFNSANVGEATTVTISGLSLTGKDATNYKLPKTVTCEGTITKANGSGTVTLDGWTYGDEAKTPQPTSTTNGTESVTYKYKVKGATEYLTGVPTAAGEYTVKATFAANDNYTEATATYDFTISPRKLTVNVKVNDKTYDGTTDATFNSTPTLDGVVGNDDVKLAHGTPTFTQATVGTNIPISFTDFSVTGDAANNYALTQPTGLTAKITPAALTLTVTAKDKKLDGNNTAKLDIQSAKLEGMIAGHESVTVGSATATFVGDGRTAQDNVTVNVTDIKLTGVDAGNYEVRTVNSVTANLLPLFVDFMNGKTKIECVEVRSYGAAVETDAPTKEGHRFAGWYTDAACTKAWNSDAGVTSDVTVYAKWTKDALYTVSGKVTETSADSSGKSGATVELWSGSACISATVTGNDGTYSFGNVPNGVYNIVAKTKDRAVTKTVTVKDGNATLDIALPTSSVAAEVEVTPGTAGEKSIVAGTTVTGMDDTLIKKVTDSRVDGTPSAPGNGERLEVKLNVKDGAQEKEVTAIKNNDTTRSNWDFVEMNVDWTKYNTANGSIIEKGKITDTVQVLAIRIPYDMSGKCNIVAYRYHAEGSEAEVAALNALSNEPSEGNYKDGTYYIGDGYIVIYTQKFSAFGVGYTADSVAPVINGAENGKTYCAAVTLTITDDNLATVTLNGTTVALTDNTLTLSPATTEQTVVATDKAGNSTSITVTVNSDHTWGAWTSNGDGTHTRICTVDSTHTEKENCTGGTATCSAAAVCTTCKASYGAVNPNNHSALTHVPYKAATVYSAGNIEYWYCSGCGKYYLDANATNAIAQPRTIIPKLYSGIRTGDDSNLALWLTLLLLSGAGIGAAMLAGRKRKHNR